MKAARVLLAITGVGLIAVGAFGLVTRAQPLPDLIGWLVGAVIAHDGVLAPVVLLAGSGLWWASARLPSPVHEVVVGGFAVAGMLTLLALPLIYRQDTTVNPTALAQNYPANLALLLTITAVATVVTAVIVRLRESANPGPHHRRRESRRRPSTGPGRRRRPGRKSRR